MQCEPARRQSRSLRTDFPKCAGNKIFSRIKKLLSFFLLFLLLGKSQIKITILLFLAENMISAPVSHYIRFGELIYSRKFELGRDIKDSLHRVHTKIFYIYHTHIYERHFHDSSLSDDRVALINYIYLFFFSEYSIISLSIRRAIISLMQLIVFDLQ